MSDKGHCKHGEFNLMLGCPECMAERQAAQESTGNVPASFGQTTAGGPLPTVLPNDNKINLCDTCNVRQQYPRCMGDDLEFGVGVAIDNIIKCGNYLGAPTAVVEVSSGERFEAQHTLTAEMIEKGEPAAVTAVIKVSPDKDEAYLKLLDETTTLFEYSGKLVIRSVDDKKAATNDLIIMGDLEKEIATLKKEWLGPIDDHRKAVFEIFRQLADTLTEAITRTKAAMLHYDEEKERERRELEEIARKERELEEAKARAEGRAPVEVTTVDIPGQHNGKTRSDLGLASTVTTYNATVVDFKLLPDDYKMPDMAKLKRVVNAAKGKVEIPGVKIEPVHNLKTSRRSR